MTPSLTLDLLQSVYAGPFASKRIARDGAVSHRTAEKWWAGLTTMRADVLIRLAQSNDKMRAELLRRLEGHGYGEEGAGVATAPLGTRAGSTGRQAGPAAAEADAVVLKRGR